MMNQFKCACAEIRNCVEKGAAKRKRGAFETE